MIYYSRATKGNRLSCTAVQQSDGGESMHIDPQDGDQVARRAANLVEQGCH